MSILLETKQEYIDNIVEYFKIIKDIKNLQLDDLYISSSDIDALQILKKIQIDNFGSIDEYNNILDNVNYIDLNKINFNSVISFNNFVNLYTYSSIFNWTKIMVYQPFQAIETYQNIIKINSESFQAFDYSSFFILSKFLNSQNNYLNLVSENIPLDKINTYIKNYKHKLFLNNVPKNIVKYLESDYMYKYQNTIIYCLIKKKPKKNLYKVEYIKDDFYLKKVKTKKSGGIYINLIIPDKKILDLNYKLLIH